MQTARSKGTAEIKALTSTFEVLMKKLDMQMSEIQEKSKQVENKNKLLNKLNRELDNFLYSTAHDLRSPLTSLLGLLNLLKHENKQNELDTYFHHMKDSVLRMEGFISQVVNYSKNKKLEIDIQEVDVKNIIDEVFLDHQFVEGCDKIRKDIVTENYYPFYSDGGRIRIIINNLISNAIRYCDKDKDAFIRIEVKVTKDKLILKFEDNGIGIAQEHLNKIFSMFYRAHDHSKGSGLGLFILSETIKKLGGKVSVQSQVGVGTIFNITVPNKYTRAKVPTYSE
ncbi:sensor histidine kinase [Chryseosolibacter indicus]|nr:HAMP domain-containing sensor histidine kinase [Chryseosolibacter indicus]